MYVTGKKGEKCLYIVYLLEYLDYNNTGRQNMV